MAETQTQTPQQPKRQRSEEQQEDIEKETHIELEEAVGESCMNNNNTKRQKYCYNDILSFLDSSEEQEEPNQDLSSLITTLQQELSSSASSEPDPEAQTSSESVMRHLLEASDDELGIPNISDNDFSGGISGEFDFDGGRLTDQGLWELEDEAALYYTLLQSELCM